MHLRRTAVLFLFLVFCCNCPFAQTRTTNELLRHLSKEDKQEYLLYKSRKEKSRAITVGIAGPILSGIGLYLLNKEGSSPNGQNSSPVRFYGAMLSSFGVVLSVSSIHMFISAGKTKREAKLLLAAQGND